MAHNVPANPLSEAVGYQLKRVVTLLRARMDEALRPVGLTVPQYACLELLRQRPGLSNAELARGAFVSRQSMNLVLRGLQERGLVERPDSVDHGRARPAQLSVMGGAVLDEASALIVAIECQMLGGLSESQHYALCSALNRCAENLE
ncbi:MarR family transcriptional regulator [Corynebacterium sp. CCM 9185]|uniref:MarR family transcriptional regulator n=1 Tax=Corynebacterium marambiense TaxID=2765364 RepID=A0ABS0VUS8_9CORY|nr:MarR family transcriptional regulator [Corynebacterium marambiense]MBI9000521.1 MarR family transcriptional regulator [Corynebacterium marambiense]MCK7663216.1 MarR family transcriptional regulator [Corynebacterium marambiense]MCX7542831.1 MarR family transcriptional regulator [Corynebacterium marambiense]